MDLSGEKIEVKIPVKEKKPRSEKQKEATARALIILKQRRDEKVKAEQEIKDSKVLAKKSVRSHLKKDLDNPVVTKKMLDQALKEHTATIAEATKAQTSQLPPPKPINLQRPSTPQPPVVMASRPTTAERLTGKALLDSIFFK
tara:strand:- start:2288 stop:2716 length:429 start_codon:yes stop_codon:yes gene_type:complete